MEGKHVVYGVLVIGILALAMGWIPVPNWLNTTQPVTTQTATATVTAPVTVPGGFQPGDFIDDVLAYNTFTPSTTSTLGAVGTATWYKQVNGAYSTIGSGTGGTLQVSADSGGYVHAAVQGTSNIYIDAWTAKAKDTKIESVEYKDIDGNGVKEFVFKINLASVTRQSGYTPHFSFNLYYMDYELPTASSTATSTTYGTTPIDKYIEFYTTQTTLQRAYAINKVDFTVMRGSGSYATQADVAKFVYMKVSIPGKGYVDVTGSLQIRTQDLYYSYSLGSDMGDSYYVKTGQNDLNKQYYTLNVKTSFTASDPWYRIVWTIYIVAPIATGNAQTVTSITDWVNVSD